MSSANFTEKMIFTLDCLLNLILVEVVCLELLNPSIIILRLASSLISQSFMLVG